MSFRAILQFEESSSLASSYFCYDKCLRSGFYDPKGLKPSEIKRFKNTLNLLRRIAARKPNYFCYGMHEWAMVHGNDKSMHQSLPFRIEQSKIDETVIERPIQCTHFDAFRFFTKESSTLNANQLSRANQIEFDQPGCVHTTMDLFKWAYQLKSLISSDLLVDCVEIALKARCIDMRASPYDLSKYEGAFGFDSSPIKIETLDGKRLYQFKQLELYNESAPIRRNLIDAYESVLRSL
mmetsp:Transcript_11895/g.17746  ORF Transcript_11895/g.17746 Transcript_11895/m.17746 type:complete len:237 (+) Transcript_11895:238-948(+)